MTPNRTNPTVEPKPPTHDREALECERVRLEVQLLRSDLARAQCRAVAWRAQAVRLMRERDERNGVPDDRPRTWGEAIPLYVLLATLAAMAICTAYLGR